MRRRRAAKNLPSDSSEDEEPLSKLVKEKKKKDDDSSSESDIETYLKPADQIDLNDPFFKTNEIESCHKIETNKSSDSESDDMEIASPTGINFTQLQEYTKKLDEAKRHIEEYNSRKRAKDNELNIEHLLAAGEPKEAEFEGPLDSSDFESYDSEKEGWEEVKETEKEKSVIPTKGLEITVEMPTAVKRKKSFDLMASIKRRINRVRKENQVLVHKVHLLCWIAHGNYVSSKISSENILTLALSLVPSKQCCPPNRTDLRYLEQVLKWFKEAVINIEKHEPRNKTFEKLLETQIIKKEANDKHMMVYIFVAVIRSLGIQCRLVLSFQVEPLRPPSNELHSLSTKASTSETRSKSTNEESKLKVEETAPRSKSTSDVIEKEPPVESKTKSDSDGAKKTSKPTNDTNGDVENVKPKPNTRSRNLPTVPKPNTTNKPQIKIKLANTKKPSNDKTTNKRILRSQKEPSNIPQLDGANDSDNPKSNLGKQQQKKTHPKRLKSLPKYREIDSEDDFEPIRSPFSRKNSDSSLANSPNLRKTNRVTRNAVIQIMKKRTESVKKRKTADEHIPKVTTKKHVESEDEFAPKVKITRRQKVKKDGEEDVKVKKEGMDVWVEVFLETEEKWISVDVAKGQIHCVNELSTRATQPVSYVVAWNNDNTLKDVTRRYCTKFNTVTRKLRIDVQWWEAALKPFVGHTTARDKEEDGELERQQSEKPLPTTISEYKNHPLYVLKRHLLKFEAIYPPDAPTLGFVRKEPVFSRACVYTLHSREIWLKHAKVVKPGEQPYKIVKARPKWDKLSNKVITDQLLEIFGPWQTQDYEPPTAENGVVPRNAFGNVELFKECMLPKKTAHLKLQGLNRIAKRMNIDCAPALIGFDFHAGWSHPVYDGYVVCEEYADELIAAWDIEEEELDRKGQEKIDKRVYGNWKRLIKGLLIRERLNAKYEFGGPSGAKKRGKKPPKLSTKKSKVGCESDTD